jgi:NAD(P)-dependent dehydrogenase (short-subunit alcohol dehydrogenase family)
MQLDNSISAVVTGGASGLGKASAQALAKAGVKVAIFDINEGAGEAVARDIGGVFCKVNILSEESVIDGLAKARAASGQERICVHCAMTARRGKTLAFDKDTGGYKRTSTEDYAFGVEGKIGRASCRERVS